MRVSLFLCISCFFMTTCASQAPIPPAETAVPQLRILDATVTARTPEAVSLTASVSVENPLPEKLTLEGISCELAVSGVTAGTIRTAGPLTIAAEGVTCRPFTFDLDLRKADGGGAAEGDSIEYGLSATAFVLSPDGSSKAVRAERKGSFPRIREPTLKITSIEVSRAELINTRLKFGLRIENPNPFPVKLDAIAYELYGEGRFWADGVLRDALTVSAHGKTDAESTLVMNFIDMKRDFLNTVIALKDVRYRFTGEASIETGVAYLPQFRMHFDVQGKSRVVE